MIEETLTTVLFVVDMGPDCYKDASRFPEKFEEEAEQNERPIARRSSVVAPATRSTSPKRVRLNPSEMSLAKKLNLTPEQYAKAKLEMEANNG